MEAVKREPGLADRLVSSLPPAGFAAAVADKSAGNFLYVTHLLKMLIDQQDRISEHSVARFPTGLDGIYRAFLKRLVTWQDWQTKYRPVMGTLAVAQAALSEPQWARLAGVEDSVVRDAVDFCLIRRRGQSQRVGSRWRRESMPPARSPGACTGAGDDAGRAPHGLHLV
jgi:hypothetical protein